MTDLARFIEELGAPALYLLCVLGSAIVWRLASQVHKLREDMGALALTVARDFAKLDKSLAVLRARLIDDDEEGGL